MKTDAENPEESPDNLPEEKLLVAETVSAPKRANIVEGELEDAENVEEVEDDQENFPHQGDFDLSDEDPLSSAFDLNQGRPFDDQQGDGLPYKSYIESAKEFFNTEILYRFDILDDADREQLAGRYRIELKGFQGGVWTISVGHKLEIINRKEDAEIVLSMNQDDFISLVNGELNPQLAILSQKMKVQGDIKKSSLFQVLLVPGVD